MVWSKRKILLLGVLLLGLVTATTTTTTALKVENDYTERIEDGDVEIDCESTEGVFTIIIRSKYDPIGAERFLYLLDTGRFFEDMGIYRVIKSNYASLVQFGIPNDPSLRSFCYDHTNAIQDPVKEKSIMRVPFLEGSISFAGNRKHSRSCQMFISTYDNYRTMGDNPWEQVIGFVTPETLPIIRKVYQGYGDCKPYNPNGVDQEELFRKGNDYLKQSFPALSYIHRCYRKKKQVQNEL